MIANKNIFPIFIVALFITGCSQESQDDTWKGTKTIRRQQTMRESGSNFKGSAQIDYNSNQGSYHMDSTADNDNYRDKTTFDDGTIRYSDTKGK